MFVFSTIGQLTTDLISSISTYHSSSPMQFFYSLGAALALSIPLLPSAPVMAAETCPIFNDISGQMEPVPTLTAWEMPYAPTGTIRTSEPGSSVNIRSGAGTEFSLIATAQPTEAITMIAHALSTDCRNWYRVEFEDDRVGWVHSQYVQSDRGFGLF